MRKTFFPQAKELHIFMDHTAHRLNVIWVLISLVTFITFVMLSQPIVFLVYGMTLATDIFSLFAFTYINFLRFLFGTQFALAVAFVRQRFRALNEHITRWSPVRSSKVACFTSMPADKFGIIFHGLCDSIGVINETFTFHFIILLGNILVACVFASYGFINEISKHNPISYPDISLNVIALLCQFMFIILIVASGSSLTKEAEKTVVVVSIVASDAHGDQKGELIGLLTHMRCRDFNVKNDMFNINWSVMIAVSFLKLSRHSSS